MHVNAAQLIEENAPKGFLKDLYESVVAAYREAKDSSSERHFAEEERNLLPFERRAEVERALKQVAIRHELKYTSVQVGRFWYVTRIFIGNIVLDSAHVKTKLAMVRRSEYRETSAETNQLIFEFMEAAKPLDSNLIYGIVLHGEDVDQPSELAFLDIAFPEHTLSAYVDHVDVCGMFRNPAAAPTITPAAQAETSDEELVKLRQQDKARKKRA